MKSTADLRAFQRLMLRAVVRPLTGRDGLQPRWIDGRPMTEVAAAFIKPNSRLTAFERLEIYNRMYWFRVIDCVADDSPGLRHLLGEERFAKLARAYLTKYPSRSFTLRNLCSRLPQFIREEPKWTAPGTRLAWDVARFEWAQTVAFDGEARPMPAPAEIAGTPPARLRLRLQPYLSLLALDFPVDDFVIAVKRRDALRAEASNAWEAGARAVRRSKRVPSPRRGRIYLVVHRHSGRLYYKRVELRAYRLLEAIGSGRPLARALSAAGGKVRPAQIEEWFATWMKLGWFFNEAPPRNTTPPHDRLSRKI